MNAAVLVPIDNSAQRRLLASDILHILEGNVIKAREALADYAACLRRRPPPGKCAVKFAYRMLSERRRLLTPEEQRAHRSHGYSPWAVIVLLSIHGSVFGFVSENEFGQPLAIEAAELGSISGWCTGLWAAAVVLIGTHPTQWPTISQLERYFKGHRIEIAIRESLRTNSPDAIFRYCNIASTECYFGHKAIKAFANNIQSQNHEISVRRREKKALIAMLQCILRWTHTTAGGAGYFALCGQDGVIYRIVYQQILQAHAKRAAQIQHEHFLTECASVWVGYGQVP